MHKPALPFFALLLMQTCLIFGQETKSQTAPRHTVTYSSEAIDPTAKKVPPHYQGNDPELVYRLLEKRESAKKKGEFESSEEYDARLFRERSKPLTGGLTTGSVLAFLLEDTVPDVDYDADEESFHVFLVPAPEVSGLVDGTSDAPFANWSTLLTKQRIETLESYNATNAFGAKVLVDSSRGYEFLIVFRGLAGFKVAGRTLDPGAKVTVDAIRFDIPIAKQRAAILKARMGALALCKLVDPNVAEHSHHYKPNFDDPVEFWDHKYFIGVELLQVWVYDRSSGEILSKEGKEIAAKP